jgi:hypothetical protein
MSSLMHPAHTASQTCWPGTPPAKAPGTRCHHNDPCKETPVWKEASASLKRGAAYTASANRLHRQLRLWPRLAAQRRASPLLHTQESGPHGWHQPLHGLSYGLQLRHSTPCCCCHSSSQARDYRAAVTASPAACRLTGPGSPAAAHMHTDRQTRCRTGLHATSLCASNGAPTPLQTTKTVCHMVATRKPLATRGPRASLSRTHSRNLPSAPAPSDGVLPHSMTELGATRPRRLGAVPGAAPLSQCSRLERRPPGHCVCATHRAARAQPLGPSEGRARPRPRPPRPLRRRHAPRACPRPRRQSHPPPRPP